MPDDFHPFVEAASTLAVVVASNEPLLFLSAELKVIAASASFCRAFRIDPASVSGRTLAQLGHGEWASPQLATLLRATALGTANIEAYEIDLIRVGEPLRRLVVHAHRLEDGNPEQSRVLLAVNDVTEARADARLKDDLIRDKAMLLQEVQHRIANSLQIIASVLMQGARGVQSEEARGHLQSAHHRVMSIAAVQRQLAVSNVGNVALRPYFSQLCESLGASMIQDPARLSIAVDVDSSVVSSDVSVSLGLIVTELVINSLKHAFPDGRGGRIAVQYAAAGTDWTLSVTDDGIGMPTGHDAPKPGLGTGIVDALTRQLDGVQTVSDAEPGTAVTITHGALEILAA